MKSKIARRILVLFAVAAFSLVTAAPVVEALPPRPSGSGCYTCKWWPFLGLQCWPGASAGRSDCLEVPSQSCYPWGAFCEVIVVH